MTGKVPARIPQEPPRVAGTRTALPAYEVTTIAQLCEAAGISPPPDPVAANLQVGLFHRPGSRHWRARRNGCWINLVNVAGPPGDPRVAAIQVLESLAFSFLDPVAREVIAGGNIFCPPAPKKTKEDQY